MPIERLRLDASIPFSPENLDALRGSLVSTAEDNDPVSRLFRRAGSERPLRRLRCGRSAPRCL